MSLLDDGPCWVLTSDAELAELWSSLMGRGGFTRRSLWLLFLDHDRVTLPVIMPIDDIPLRPSDRDIHGLLGLVGELRRDSGVEAFAALLSRPGPATLTLDDRAWAARLTRAAREQGVPMWPVHLATRDRVHQVAADDLIDA